MFSPFITHASSVREIMFKVLLALLPGIALYVWYFGPAILVSITLASVTALATEAAMLKLRRRPIMPFLKDNSALLTAWLLALSIPPLAPWWLVVVGTMFAISISKHLYGGLGNNPFNPAMIGYAVLIISFPVYMTHWISPQGMGQLELSFVRTIAIISSAASFPSGVTLDAVSMATPLDTLKTQLHSGQPMQQTSCRCRSTATSPAMAARWSRWVLCWAESICWLTASSAGICLSPFWPRCLPLPAYFICSIRPTMHRRCSTGFPARRCWPHFSSSPIPSPAPPRMRGKLIFAAGAGFLTYIIRVFGGFPDGVAFATLLMNICVPLIDAYTQPKVFGKKGSQMKRLTKATLRTALNLLFFTVHRHRHSGLHLQPDP